MRCKVLYPIVFVASFSGCASFMPGPAEPVAAPAPAPSAKRSEALLQALLALGVDYRYGGNSPVTGFDCSGLVAHVYQEAWGIRLPHSTQAQSEAGVPVSLSELQPGDLVFYDTQKRPYSHVGIYMGNGRFVHAPKSGARVRFESLESRYWSSRFSGARRIAPSI
jgi:cell wall-associated NlpC family hydrolase